MKTALANQDISGALNYYAEESQSHYNQVFIYVEDNVAQYRIKKTEVYSGQTFDITYYIYFVVDENGIWKIRIF